MTVNEHGVDTALITVGAKVRGIEADTGAVRMLKVNGRVGGRLRVTTCDARQPQGSTDLFHVNDVTSIVQER